MGKGPLEGIRVVELTNFVAAPIAGRFMAEWGADVIKIESVNGDPARRIIGTSWGVPEKWRNAGHDIGYDLANWDKRFISINLKEPEGLRIVRMLLESADVFITNYREKVLNALKLDYESLKEDFPALVYAHIVGYGEKGAESGRPGFDNTTFAARGGFSNSMRQKNGVPPNVMGAFGDQICGAFLSSGICAALTGKERTGKGDKVVVSLLGSAVYCMAYGIEQAQFEGVQSYPRDRAKDNNPFLNTYQALDDAWLQLNVPVYDGNFARIMRLIGREDLADHRIYSSLVNVNRYVKKEEVTRILEEGFRKKTADEWVRLFTEADLTIEKHYSTYDISEDAQVLDNDYIVERTYPDGEQMKLVQCPIKLYSVGVPEFRPTGEIGADTEEILKEYGYGNDEIDALKQADIIRMPEKKA